MWIDTRRANRVIKILDPVIFNFSSIYKNRRTVFLKKMGNDCFKRKFENERKLNDKLKVLQPLRAISSREFWNSESHRRIILRGKRINLRDREYKHVFSRSVELWIARLSSVPPVDNEHDTALANRGQFHAKIFTFHARDNCCERPGENDFSLDRTAWSRIFCYSRKGEFFSIDLSLSRSRSRRCNLCNSATLNSDSILNF